MTGTKRLARQHGGHASRAERRGECAEHHECGAPLRSNSEQPQAAGEGTPDFKTATRETLASPSGGPFLER